ncbi:MAG TPA: VCBS repeat-containing protein [Longimicrobium sp.]|nr:VCBS repeat-containing protein [Longimicrobium sp.]
MTRPTRTALGTLAAIAALGGSSCEPARTPGSPAVASAPAGDAAGTGAQPAGTASYPVGARPRALAVADLDGDGDLDVAVANSGDGTVSILLGAGGGRLSAGGAPIQAGREPSDLNAADLDRDGDADLVVANHETSGVTVLLNDGLGRFAPAPRSPYETGARPHLHGLATADFDGDGWVDVAVESADTREIRVLRGRRGGFGAAVGVPVGTMPYYRLGVADVTGDGRADVLVPGHGDSTVRVVHAVAGRLAPWNRVIRLADKPWMVVGARLDGDARADVAVAHSHAVSVWLGGADRFSAAPGSPHAIAGATELATGDLDGDRVTDVAVGPWEGAEVVVISGGGGARRTIRACPRPIGLAVADLDRDGLPELLAACTTENRVVVITDPLARL